MQLTYIVLYVADVARAAAFYREAFDLTHTFTHDSGDYAELSTGATTLAFCTHELAEQLLGGAYRRADREQRPLGCQLTLEPNDVAAGFEQAVRAGAKPIAAPARKPWGFDVAFVQDLDGHLIELARRVDADA